MPTPFHIRGDTFDRSGPVTVTQDGVVLTDLTGWTGKCQIRTAGGALIAEPVFTWLNAATGLCRLNVPNTTGTADWPLGEAKMDIQFTAPSGDIVSTLVARIDVLEDATHASA